MFPCIILQNSRTPHSTATMPLGLGGGGAIGGDTLKPVIPPFLPQPSFDLASETWGVPATQQKSQSTLDLTVVRTPNSLKVSPWKRLQCCQLYADHGVLDTTL